MAAIHNFVLDQGSTFDETIYYKDSDGNAIDLTGYASRMHLRESYKSEYPSLSLSEGSGLTTSPDGSIRIQISADQSAAITAKNYVYDLEIFAGEVVKRLIEGRFVITPEATR